MFSFLWCALVFLVGSCAAWKNVFQTECVVNEVGATKCQKSDGGCEYGGCYVVCLVVCVLCCVLCVLCGMDVSDMSGMRVRACLYERLGSEHKHNDFCQNFYFFICQSFPFPSSSPISITACILRKSADQLSIQSVKSKCDKYDENSVPLYHKPILCSTNQPDRELAQALANNMFQKCGHW